MHFCSLDHQLGFWHELGQEQVWVLPVVKIEEMRALRGFAKECVIMASHHSE